MVARTYTSDTDQLASVLSSAFDRIATLERSVGWRPGGTSYVISPAYAGPGYWAERALFSHKDVFRQVGMHVIPPGDIDIITDSGQNIQFYACNAAHTGHDLLLDLKKGGVAISPDSGGFMIGNHPQHSSGDWVAGYSIPANSQINGAEYTFLVGKPGTGVAGLTLLNGWTALELRVGNGQRQSMQAGGAKTTYNCGDCHDFVGSQVRGHYQTADGNYWSWPVISWGASGYASFSGIHAEGTAACAFRIYPGQGEAMYAVNANNNQHTPVGGSAWVNMSSASFKTDIESLRPEREHIVVAPRDPKSWRVEQPDIMALRAVRFFPKGPGAMRPVQDADGEWRATEPYPDDNWIGHDSRRERLGLIAEEVQEVIPSSVHHDEDGNAIGIDYAQVTVALLDHVQQLTELVATLRYRITELENRP